MTDSLIYFWKDGKVATYDRDTDSPFAKGIIEQGLLDAHSYEPAEVDHQMTFGMYKIKGGMVLWNYGDKESTPPEFLLALMVMGVLVH